MQDTITFISITFLVLYIFFSVISSMNISFEFGGECAKKLNSEDGIILHELLLSNFVIFKHLNIKQQKRFKRRVCKFIRMKKFKAAGELKEVSFEMKVMIAATAIQITYGLPDLYFTHFQMIILYEKEYYSEITGDYHFGEVNAMGAIVLSWENFLFGYSNQTDGRNLAIHEMAHALLLSNILDIEEYNFINKEEKYRFDELAYEEIQKIEDGESNFFREYGATNLQEFFAVTVECFFEQPVQFKAYNHALYMQLVKILRIDILNYTAAAG